MKKETGNIDKRLKDEEGVVLVIALIMLCMMTIIGTAVSNTSSIEILISGAEKDSREAFYVAEAGVDHAKGILKGLIIPGNTAKIAGGQDPDWDFALNGSESGVNQASGGSYDGGAIWITNGTIGGDYTYSVRVWNNSDAGGATNDIDGVIYLRSVATSPRGGSTSIEVSIQASVSDVEAVTGYVAQAGGGSGKSYSSEDAEAISDFSQQI